MNSDNNNNSNEKEHHRKKRKSHKKDDDEDSDSIEDGIIASKVEDEKNVKKSLFKSMMNRKPIILGDNFAMKIASSNISNSKIITLPQLLQCAPSGNYAKSKLPIVLKFIASSTTQRGSVMMRFKDILGNSQNIFTEGSEWSGNELIEDDYYKLTNYKYRKSGKVDFPLNISIQAMNSFEKIGGDSIEAMRKEYYAQFAPFTPDMLDNKSSFSSFRSIQSLRSKILSGKADVRVNMLLLLDKDITQKEKNSWKGVTTIAYDTEGNMMNMTITLEKWMELTGNVINPEDDIYIAAMNVKVEYYENIVRPKLIEMDWAPYNLNTMQLSLPKIDKENAKIIEQIPDAATFEDALSMQVSNGSKLINVSGYIAAIIPTNRSIFYFKENEKKYLQSENVVILNKKEGELNVDDVQPSDIKLVDDGVEIELDEVYLTFYFLITKNALSNNSMLKDISLENVGQYDDENSCYYEEEYRVIPASSYMFTHLQQIINGDAAFSLYFNEILRVAMGQHLNFQMTLDYIFKGNPSIATSKKLFTLRVSSFTYEDVTKRRFAIKNISDA